MNSDKDLHDGTQRLLEIALTHSNNEHSSEEIEEALNVLRQFSLYAHKVSGQRPVQISQIENNISDIRRILNSPSIEGHYPIISQHIENLCTYCGA
ncbi:hypothetical protein ACVBE9_12095 [Eionea flava]